MKNGHYEAKCSNCQKIFERRTGQHPKYKHESSWSGHHFCSTKCVHDFRDKKVTQPCGWCDKPATSTLADFKRSKSGFIFCNQSCSASYNNTQRRKSRRSKVEKMLCELLINEYPNLEIIPNDKTILNGYEADIAIPDLNLAIEWNGIVHYRPIYGNEKLLTIQQRDKEKQEIAEQKGIHLIVIPDLVSTEKYVKEAFQKIKQIINRLNQK